MAQLIPINRFTPSLRENLLPTFCDFETNDTWSVTTAGGVSATTSTDFPFESTKSLKINVVADGSTVKIGTIASSATQMQSTVTKAGYYIFTVRMASLTVIPTYDFSTQIFINGLPTSYDFTDVDVKELKYKTYFFQQYLNVNDVVNFNFIISCKYSNSFYVDAMKLEYINDGLYIPSGYSKKVVPITNESGQIKANYRTNAGIGTPISAVGVTTSTYTGAYPLTLNVTYFNIVSTPPLSISSAPTTIYPYSAVNKSYADLFDATRGITPVVGRLIENPVQGQKTLWRIKGRYFNKVNSNVGNLYLRLTNPVSGFVNDKNITCQDGTGAIFSVVFETIADDASILSPNGYVLGFHANFSDVDITFEIDEITRFDIPVENK